MRILFIVNSIASSVTARRRVVIHKALSADHDVTLAETSRRGHATRLAQSAARKHFDLVIVLGGDGTFNEAANGLAGTDTALGVLPGGSTNVFARILGLPDDSVDAAGVLLEALAAGNIRRVGLGSVEGPGTLTSFFACPKPPPTARRTRTHAWKQDARGGTAGSVAGRAPAPGARRGRGVLAWVVA